MSHFTTIKTSNQFTSPQLLVDALTEAGYADVTYSKEPQKLKDYYSLRGGKAITQAKANVIVPYSSNKRKCMSDFGFLEVNGVYELRADSGDDIRIRGELPRIQQTYNQLKIKAMVDNINLTATALNKGTPQIDISEEEGKTTVKIAFPSDIRRNNQLKQQTIRR